MCTLCPNVRKTTERELAKTYLGFSTKLECVNASITYKVVLSDFLRTKVLVQMLKPNLYDIPRSFIKNLR